MTGRLRRIDGAVVGSRLAIACLGLAVFAAHASIYGSWLIDDAGISFAYATNLASGHGLVSQPGATPVEGYSNALWVFLLAALSRMGALALPWGPKLISGALIAGTYALLLAFVSRIAVRRALVGVAVVLCCSANPSFVVWSVSGLENALYTLTIVGLAYLTLRALEATRAGAAFATCGVAASMVAMTRPDGVLYALVPPVVALAAGKRDRDAFLKYAAGFGAPFAAFMLARIVTFHRVVPNTAVAKGGPSANEVFGFLFLMPAGVEKLEGLLEGAFAGLVANAVVIAAIFAGRVAAKRGRFNVALAVVVTFSFAALADFMLMPSDWMRENRFGTPFFPLYYVAVFCLIDLALDTTSVRRKDATFAVLTGALWTVSFPDFAGRSLSFERSGNISLSYVRRAYAERFDRYADTLGVERASALLPDVGGMLLWSKVRVIDLAGLCDAEIAGLRSRDPTAERQYIFADVRPTFIHTYGIWSRTVEFEKDQRLARDYEAIHAYTADEDPKSDGHASGIFIRRDALVGAGGEASLEAFRREPHNRLAFLRPERPSVFRRWLESTALVPQEYRADSSANTKENKDIR